MYEVAMEAMMEEQDRMDEMIQQLRQHVTGSTGDKWQQSAEDTVGSTADKWQQTLALETSGAQQATEV